MGGYVIQKYAAKLQSMVAYSKREMVSYVTEACGYVTEISQSEGWLRLRGRQLCISEIGRLDREMGGYVCNICTAVKAALWVI